MLHRKGQTRTDAIGKHEQRTTKGGEYRVRTQSQTAGARPRGSEGARAMRVLFGGNVQIGHGVAR